MPVSRKNTKKTPPICASRQKLEEGVDIATKLLYNVDIVRDDKGGNMMKAQEILSKAMSNEKVTQKAMAEAMGLKSAQAIGNILYRENSVRVSSFVKMLNLMGYEVVVRKKLGASEEWKVD